MKQRVIAGIRTNNDSRQLLVVWAKVTPRWKIGDIIRINMPERFKVSQ